MQKKTGQLNHEVSMKCSGTILSLNKIPILKESDYYVRTVALDGDAPKQFIKAYFYEEGSSVRRLGRSSWIPYIAKTAEKWYPHESVVEFMINRIGQELGLVMNEVRQVRANGQIRFLSRYFLKENERLVHGAEICGEHLNDLEFARQIAEHKDSARDLFTFEFICAAIEAVYPSNHRELIRDLVKMVAFDGIVGNNDRHFYNWGIIDTVKRSSKPPTFAPVFDSARGLLWNTSDEGVVKHWKNYKNSGKKIVHYVERAYPRISIEQNKEANHFELLSFIKQQHPDFKRIIDDLANPQREEHVLHMLEKEFYPFFIPERRALIRIILQTRFNKVREV